MTTDEQFNTALNTWLEKCQEMINEYYAKNLTNLTPPTLTLHRGKRYVKVQNEGSAYAFIDITGGMIAGAMHKRGDVLKPASWKIPARWARGNIFDSDNGTKYMSPFGPAYLNGYVP